MKYKSYDFILSVVTVFFTLSLATTVAADITRMYTLDYMEPENSDARDFSKGNFGGSFEYEFHFVGIPDPISWAAGFDYIDMLSEETTYYEESGLRIVQETDQEYYRFWFGPRIRSHANAFFRPYIGLHGALIYNMIETDVVVPDDYDPDNEIRQILSSDGELLFGYDVSTGLEIKVAKDWSIDLGMKRLKTFGEPRQLSYGAVTVHPSYNLYFIGVRYGIAEETDE